MKTRSIDIVNSDKFIQANDMFDRVKRIAKSKGYGVVESYPPIDDLDLAKLREYGATTQCQESTCVVEAVKTFVT